MIDDKKISLVIPCYNEEIGLAEILKNDLSFIDEVLVVDNNSTDNTAVIALENNCKLFKEKQKGYGAAYKTGLANAAGDIIVTMDGDNTYPTTEIERLVKALLEKKLDFISASRLDNGRPSSMGLVNYLGNKILTITTRLLYFRKIKDSQSGMWILRREVLEKIKPKSNGMAFSQEIKIEAIKNGLNFAELDIPYNERLGEVKLNKWKDGFVNLFFLFYKRFF